MAQRQSFDNQFNRADANHDGTIDEREFRQFLGPVIKDERRLSGNVSAQDAQRFSVSLNDRPINPIVLSLSLSLVSFRHRHPLLE